MSVIKDLFDKHTEQIECLITLDFESHYDSKSGYSLSRMTTADYVRDPRFEALGVGVKIDEGETRWMEIPAFTRWARTLDWSKVATCAFNAFFDNFILSERFDVHPGFMFCPMTISKALNSGKGVGGSLAKLSTHYGVGVKGDEVIHADGKRRKDFTDEEFARYGEYCRNDTQLAWGVLQAELATGFAESELWLVDHTIRMYTETSGPRGLGFVLDEPLLEEYLIYERSWKRELLCKVAIEANARLTDAQVVSMTDDELLAAAKSTLMSNDKLAQLLIDMGVEPPEKVSVAKTKTALAADPDAEPVMTWAFAKSDPGMQALLEHEREDVRALADARVGVKSTINETRTERVLRIGRGGKTIPLKLNFSGAHTHRFSGGDKINAQNFERTSKKDPRKGTIRKALKAPKGRVVVVADSAQIEARKLAWLAREESLLEVFRDPKRDVYDEFAMEIYGGNVDRKHNPDDVLKGFISKCATLGLGYNLGAFKFATMLLQGMLGGPRVQFKQEDADQLQVNLGKFVANENKVNRCEEMPFARLTLEERIIHTAVAEAIVYKWRNARPNIVAFWKLMEEVLTAMEEGTEATFGPESKDFPGGCLQTIRHGIVGPNGLVMYYPGLRKSEDGYGYSYMGGATNKERKHIYGGLLTENIVQYLSRVTVTDQWLRIAGKFGPEARPILFAHDELVYLPKESEGRLLLERVVQEMKVPSEWAENLPLSAEGGLGPSYGTAKP